MFLEDGGKVCVDGFPSSVHIDGVCCRWGLVQCYECVERCCCWALVGMLRRVCAHDGEETAQEASGLVHVNGWLA